MTLFGSTDDTQVDNTKPLRRITTDNHGEHEISDVVNNSEDDTRYADTQIEVFSAGGTAASSRTRFDCENGASAYHNQGSQNYDEASSSQKLNIGYSRPQNPESTSPSSRSDSRRTRTSKNGTTSLQIQDSKNVEECHDTQLCVFDHHFESSGPKSPSRMAESSRDDFRRQSTAKNGTTSLSKADPKKIEECRDIQLCVFNEHFGQDSQSRMSPKSFREEFQRQQTLKNGATVLQNQDTEKSEKCRQSQLCVLDQYFEHKSQDSPFRMPTDGFRNYPCRQTLRTGTTVLSNTDLENFGEYHEAQLCDTGRYPKLIEKETGEFGHFYADTDFTFESTAQAYENMIKNCPGVSRTEMTSAGSTDKCSLCRGHTFIKEDTESVPARFSQNPLRANCSNVLMKTEVLDFKIPPAKTEDDQECLRLRAHLRGGKLSLQGKTGICQCKENGHLSVQGKTGICQCKKTRPLVYCFQWLAHKLNSIKVCTSTGLVLPVVCLAKRGRKKVYKTSP